MAVHAITAQPGGDDAIRAKLVTEGCVLSFPVHSDPELRLQGSATADILVHEQIDATRHYYTSTHDQTTEVEPALVVADSSGAVVSRWSWNAVDALKEGGIEALRQNGSGERDPGLHTIDLAQHSIPGADGADEPGERAAGRG